VKTGGGGLLFFFLKHLRCQSLSRPLAQYVKLLLPSNAPECLDTYSSSHPSANQQSMPTSAVPMEPLTFQSVSAALLPKHPYMTALPVQNSHLTELTSKYRMNVLSIHQSVHPPVNHPSIKTQHHLYSFQNKMTCLYFTWLYYIILYYIILYYITLYFLFYIIIYYIFCFQYQPNLWKLDSATK